MKMTAAHRAIIGQRILRRGAVSAGVVEDCMVSVMAVNYEKDWLRI
jgi:hypothetical protein